MPGPSFNAAYLSRPVQPGQLLPPHATAPGVQLPPYNPSVDFGQNNLQTQFNSNMNMVNYYNDPRFSSKTPGMPPNTFGAVPTGILTADGSRTTGNFNAHNVGQPQAQQQPQQQPVQPPQPRQPQPVVEQEKKNTLNNLMQDGKQSLVQNGKQMLNKTVRAIANPKADWKWKGSDKGTGTENTANYFTRQNHGLTKTIKNNGFGLKSETQTSEVAYKGGGTETKSFTTTQAQIMKPGSETVTANIGKNGKELIDAGKSTKKMVAYNVGKETFVGTKGDMLNAKWANMSKLGQAANAGAGVLAVAGAGIAIGGEFKKGKTEDGKNHNINGIAGSAALVAGGVATGIATWGTGATAMSALGTVGMAAGSYATAAITLVDGVQDILVARKNDVILEDGKRVKSGKGIEGSAKVAGVAIGATIGSIFPGVGTALGAAIGAGVGMIVGKIASRKQKKKAEDAKTGLTYRNSIREQTLALKRKVPDQVKKDVAANMDKGHFKLMDAPKKLSKKEIDARLNEISEQTKSNPNAAQAAVNDLLTEIVTAEYAESYNNALRLKVPKDKLESPRSKADESEAA